jgi:succinoglycan biosynthesis transport protein ExoP
MDLSQFIRLLRARRRLFWSVLGGVLLAAIILAFVMPKTYLGEVSVVVDSKLSDPITGMVMPEQMMSTNIATQIDVIQSHNVALKVVDKLHLTDKPSVREDFLEDTDGEGSIRDWLADKLGRHLTVKPSRLSNMIVIRVTAPEPGAAAALANAFGEAYMQTSLELSADPARRQAAWFDAQIRDLRGAVDTAQGRLSEYQRKENMVGASDDHLDVESAKLSELTTQFVAAQTAVFDARTRLKQVDQALVHGNLEELPDIIGNPVLQSMKVDLVRAQGNLAETEQRFDHNHPQYLSAAAQVKALQAKLVAEINVAKGSITQTADIAEKRANQLQSAVDEQKAHILDLKRRHDQLDILDREVTAAQHAYDAASQRASEVRLQGQLDQSNIAILNPAVVPLKPWRPKLWLNSLVGLVLGASLALGAVLITELRNRKVHSRDDLIGFAGIMVLAEMPRLTGRSRRVASRSRTRRFRQQALRAEGALK